MDFLILLLSIICVWTWINLRKSSTTKLPPGPRPFPVIGNLLELGSKPHHSLANLSRTYGPLMTLKLGNITTIIISSPDTAKQVLQKNDHLLSNRTIPDAVQTLNHPKFSMVWLPPSAHWRNLRKICALHLFSLQQLDAGQALRQKKVQELINLVHQSCSIGGGDQAVDIGRAAFTTSLNLISNTIFSIDLAHYHSNSSQEFRDHVSAMMKGIGKPNIADYFPAAFRLLDPQGVRREMRFYVQKLFGIFDGIVNQRLQLRASSMISSVNKDVLDVLLKLTQDNDFEFSCKDINHLLLDLFTAGTDTTSNTLEWAMAELLHNPTTLSKARNELEEVIGKDRAVQESDIPSLPYLQAVVKETLRLHPPAPFLLPRKAGTDVEISGFIVPKDAQIQVNVWAIGRDPGIWSNPNSYLPERFLESKIDVKGRDFELIPFGAGRRICPGLQLGHRMVHLMLASLLHSFEWKLENGMKSYDMDMNDKFGITLAKAKPLRAIPIKRWNILRHVCL